MTANDQTTRDVIRILGLEVACVIGTLPEERTKTQPVIIDIELGVALDRAAASDNLNDTVDYLALRDEVFEKVSASDFALIERLAGFIVDLCLARPGVHAVTVRVAKPQALPNVRTVEVELSRDKRQQASSIP